MKNAALSVRRHAVFFAALAASVVFTGFAHTNYVTRGQLVTGYYVQWTDHPDQTPNTVSEARVYGNGAFADAAVKLQTGDGKVNAPHAVVRVGDDIYVWDEKWESGVSVNQSQIKKFARDFSSYTVFVDNIPVHHFDHAILSPDGQYFYCTSAFNAGSGTVYRYKVSDGTGGAYITGLSTTRGMCFDGGGLFYVAARGSGKVVAYDVSGETPVSKVEYSHKDSGGGSFMPCGVLVDDEYGYVYCFGHAAKSSMIFKKDGTFVKFISTPGNTQQAYFFGDMILMTAYDAAWFSSAARIKSDDGDLSSVQAYQGGSHVGSFTLHAEPDTTPTTHWYRFEDGYKQGCFTNSMDAAKDPIQAIRACSTPSGGIEGGALLLGSASGGGRCYIPGSVDLIPSGARDFSLFFWMAAERGTTIETDERRLFSNRRDGSDSGRTFFSLENMGRPDMFNGSLGTHITAPDACDDSKWHHIGFVRDANTVEIWVDGACVTRQTPSTTFQVGGEGRMWAVGVDADLNSYCASGQGSVLIDDVRVWRRALLTNEIHDVYAQYAASATATPSFADPVDRARLDIVDKYGVCISWTQAYKWGSRGVSIAHAIGPDGTNRVYVANGHDIPASFKSNCGDVYMSKGFDGKTGATAFSWMGQPPNMPTVVDVNGTVHVVGIKSTGTTDTGLVYREAPLTFDGQFGTYADSPSNDCHRDPNRPLCTASYDGTSLWVPYETEGSGLRGYVKAPVGLSTAVFGDAAAFVSDLPAWYELPKTGLGTFVGENVVRYMPSCGQYLTVVSTGTALNLYSYSAALRQWKFVRTIVEVETADIGRVSFRDVSFDINGRGLEIAFLVAAPDGNCGPRSLETPNFLVYRHERKGIPEGMMLLFR